MVSDGFRHAKDQKSETFPAETVGVSYNLGHLLGNDPPWVSKDVDHRRPERTQPGARFGGVSPYSKIHPSASKLVPSRISPLQITGTPSFRGLPFQVGVHIMSLGSGPAA